MTKKSATKKTTGLGAFGPRGSAKKKTSPKTTITKSKSPSGSAPVRAEGEGKRGPRKTFAEGERRDTTIRLTLEQNKRVREVALEYDMSINDMVITALSKVYFEGKGLPKL